jgi:uncharacterized protein YfaS (alpha-2-macroglobulin family)
MLARTRLSTVVTLLLLLSVGCNGFASQLGPASPTPTRAPGPEALPPLPPTLVESIPAPGEEMPVDGSITLYFDQPMDPEVTEDAFSLDPTVEGRFEWPDDQTLRFEPREPLERATTYLLTVSAGATSQAGMPIDEPIRLPVTTVGPLLVAQVSPSPGSTDVDPAAVLTVVFNRPVVPLQLTGDTPEPLELEPDVPGRGEWIDTGIYLFYPDPALPGGATVRVRVGAGLTDLTGASLDETFEWTFTTSLPQIISLSPEPHAQGVALDGAVVIGFNQTMDAESVEGAFTLRDESSNPVAGSFSWNETASEVTFAPDSPFPYDTSYVLEVSDSARAASDARLSASLQTTFRSVPEPSVVSSNPSQGGLLGRYDSVEIYFSAPMDEASLLSALSITPEVEDLSGYFGARDRSYSVYGSFAPSSTYTLRLAQAAADPYGTRLRGPFSLTFRTPALAPFVRFQRYSHTLSLTPTFAPQVEVNVRNVRRLDLELYEVRPDDIFWMDQDWELFYEARNPPGHLIHSWSQAVSPPQDVSQIVTVALQSTPLSAGLYFLTLDSPNDGEAPVGRLLLVRQIELVLKFSASRSLVWAVDLSTGQPAAGLSVELLNPSGRPFAAGMTDEEGIWIAEYPTRTREQLWEEVYVASGSPEEGSFGLTSSAWNEGLESHEFDIWTSLWREEYTANLYTDRPIYRPGQPVRFRGVLRRNEDARYALPDLESVAVTVYDGWSGESLYAEDLPLSDFGTFDGEFTLSGSARPGGYMVNTEYGSVSFTVAQYRRPEFTVRVEPSETNVADGDPLTVLISAEYYFGGAVPDAQVHWRAWAQPYYPPGAPLAIDWFGEFFEAGYYGEGFGNLLAEGEGQTGPDGTLVIDAPTALEGDRPIRVTIEATLTERTGLPVTGRGAFALHPALVYFGVSPVRYAVRAGEEALIEIQATDWAGERVAGHGVEVLFERVSWRQVVTPDGEIEWESTSELVDASTVRTTTEGPVTVGFVPDRAGTYRITASGADRAGRQATSRATIWVSGPGSVVWRQRLPGQMILVPDREAYEPGQTARVLVPSPFDVPVPALVSIERGSVLRRWVTTIGGDQSEVEIPISIDDAPNVYLSVVLIRPSSEDHPANIATGLVELTVSARSFELNVTLTPDRTTAGPGEQVTYQLKATDAAGRPVQAEFSLGLADLAALSLAEPNSVDLFDAFYSRARLGVLTAASLSNASEGLTAAPEEEEGGRGGGGGEGEPPEVRGEFPDTAFWDASIVTDADGRASVTLTLPDSLTTWRMDARGTTVNTRVGQTTVDLIATRDLLIRPVTPRFFTAGDAASVAGVVHNNTDQDLPVEVWLVATGAAVDGQDRQSLTVPAGGQVRVDWGLVVEDVPGVALTFHVSGGGLQDASRPTIGSAQDGVLPVLRYTAPDTVATAGALDEAGSRIEVINLPRRFDPSQGELRVNLEPSLGSAMNTALQELEDYPYLCTEQVVSRFLPNLAVYIALRELGLEEPELQARLERTLAASLEILRSRQMDDGSWGWWTYPPGDVYLTSYALYGFLLAGEAGFETDENAVDRAATFLRYRVRGPTPEDTGTDDSDRQAFLLYVLTLAGSPNPSVARRMVDFRENMSPWGQSLLALALHDMEPDDEAIPGLLAGLNTTVIRSATGAHWEDEGIQGSGMISSIGTTAQALRALLALEPDNPLAADAVRWLLAARMPDGSWRTTHESAWALLALADWVRHAGGLRADYDYSVDLNGLRLSEGTATPGEILPPVTLTTPIAELDPTLPNQLAVRRGPGRGLLTYTAHLSVYRPVEDVEAVSRGLMVSREYYRYDGECGATDAPCPLATSVAAGEDVLVRVTLVVPSDQYYLVLEDPYPAGMDPINTRLETAPTFGIPSDFSLVDPLRGGWGWWYFTRSDLGDDHLALFADHLPAGTYQYTYVLHATLAGEYRVLPTRAWAFYFPEVYGHGEGRVFTIQP